MWVQEGNDCKESETDIPRRNLSLFERLYSYKKKNNQSVSTTAIPMATATFKEAKSLNSIYQKSGKSIIDNGSDQKEPEKSESVSPNLKSCQSPAVPISPAQFLENMSPRARGRKTKSRLDEEDEDSTELKMEDLTDSPAFTIDDSDIEKYSGTDMEIDCDKVGANDEILPNTEHLDLTIIGKAMKIERLDDIDISVLDTTENEDDGDLDLTVYGTKCIMHQPLPFGGVYYPDFTFAEHRDIEPITPFYQECNQENKLYISPKFNGLDIKHDFEWNECLEHSQNNGLLVVELYCTVFGASDVMWPYVDEILHKRQDEKIKFVRLNVNRMDEIEEIKQVIVNYDKYYQSPIPSFVFIKNKEQVHRLKGTKPAEFGQLIEKYAVNEKENGQSGAKENEVMQVKYTSILQSKSMNVSPRKRAVKSKPFKEENIKNLINKMAVNQAVSTMNISPTKLFKRQQIS